jgi:RNA polymerase sigma-70 factor (ECF subfamily)
MQANQQAIAEFIEVYRSDVFRMALSILDDPAEADEAAQDVLLRALISLHNYRREGKLTTWLYTITLNVCRGRHRKRRNRQRLLQALYTLSGREMLENNQLEEQAMQNESEANIWRAVRSLPENLRIVITLRYYQALPISEIAEILGISERAVH